MPLTSDTHAELGFAFVHGRARGRKDPVADKSHQAIRPTTVWSAGILLNRRSATSELEVWIAHMGGPFWAHKDARAWSIPKGEYLKDEDPLVAAQREFAEEIGTPAPQANYIQLGSFRQPSGKVITVFTAESDFEPE